MSVWCVYMHECMHMYSFPVHMVRVKTIWFRWSRVCLQCRRPEFDPWVRKIPWRKKWQPTPIFLPGESYGQRNLADYSP